MADGVNFDPSQTNCRHCGFPTGINYVCSNCFNYTWSDANQSKQDVENQQRNNSLKLEALQNLKEEVEFLTKWSFTPGEASPTADITILCTSDGTLLHAHSLVLVSYGFLIFFCLPISLTI